MSSEQVQIVKLQKILDVARQLAATTDLDALLRTIIDEACHVLECERATIFLYDPRSKELFSRVATGAEAIRFPADRGVAGAAARQRQVVNVPDAYADPRFNPEIDKQTGFRTRNLLSFPLENLDGELMGVLQAVNKVSGPFHTEDEELGRVLGAQAGVALHRWHLLQQYAEKQRMARDLEIARSIQRALLPKKDPQIPGYEIAGWNRSADETGGDCYDFVPLPDGRLALVMADATGHGIGAALVIAEFRSLVRAMLSVTLELGAALTRVNRLLADDLQSERFVTAFVGILDPARHRIDYVSAGQGPLLVYTAAGAVILPATGLPLAVIDDTEYAAEPLELPPGGALILLTDGFYEAANAAGEQFGERRVVELIRSQVGLPLTALIARLHEAVVAFAAGGAYADDLTAVLLRRSG